jgi:hypothetical protein
MFLIGVLLASFKNVSAVTTTSESKFALSDLFRWGSKPEVQEGEQSTTLTEEELRELKNQNGLKHGIYSKRRPSGSAARPECKDCVDGKSNKVCRLRNCRLIKKTICRERSCENMEHMPSGEMPMASGMEVGRVPRIEAREGVMRAPAGSELPAFAGTFERVMNPLQGIGGFINQESGANEGVRNGQEVSSGENRQYEQNESGVRPSSGWGPQPSSGSSPRPSSGWGPEPSSGSSPRPSSGWGPQPSSGSSPRPSSGWVPKPPSGSSPRPSGSGKGHHQYQKHYQHGSGPSPSTPHPSPSTPHPSPSTPNPSPSTPNPSPSTPHPSPSTPHPSPSTPNPSPSTPNPSPSTPHPSPSTPGPRTRGQNFIQLNSAATNRKIGEPFNLKAIYHKNNEELKNNYESMIAVGSKIFLS